MLRVLFTAREKDALIEKLEHRKVKAKQSMVLQKFRKSGMLW